MAFDSLSSRLQMALRRVTGKGKLNESDIDDMLKEVRLSLLEADVNYKVVKDFLKRVKEQAYGEKIMKGLNPGQQVVKIVREELKNTLGSETTEINCKPQGKMTVIMMAGLQGAGKTTAVGKLAVFFRKKYNKKPFLIAADIYRPAAIDQLQTIGKQIGVPVFDMGTRERAEKIVKEGLKEAQAQGCDFVIIDTAGRLHINEELMDELVRVKEVANPDEILLTVDAMTGQDAVNVALSFHEKLNVTDRLADRILGMGDVLSLIDTVTENVDEDEMMDMAEKLMSNKFNYNDLLKQLKMFKRMGSISKILGFLPGLGNVKQAMKQIDGKEFDRLEVMISSMTEEERKNPKLIDQSASRRLRIANGSGRSVAEVNKLRELLESQVKTMKKMSSMSETDMQRMAAQVQNGQMPGGMPKQKMGKGKGKGNFRF